MSYRFARKRPLIKDAEDVSIDDAPWYEELTYRAFFYQF